MTLIMLDAAKHDCYHVCCQDALSTDRQTPMRYPASETAEKHVRILQAASELFRKHGFSGVSVGEVMRTTGLTHGPFYNHFASKQALMTECIEHASRSSLDAVATAGASRENLLAHLDNYLSSSHRDTPEQGCLLASLATDVSREPQVRPTLARHLSAAIDHLSRAWHGSTKKVARRESLHTLSAIVGAMVLSRAVGDSPLSDEILDSVRQKLGECVRGAIS
jgi:TetR/AcrR family transcriptional repressor of nem operon